MVQSLTAEHALCLCGHPRAEHHDSTAFGTACRHTAAGVHSCYVYRADPFDAEPPHATAADLDALLMAARDGHPACCSMPEIGGLNHAATFHGGTR